jgi:N-acetylglucosaminyldiphosphoundecaprenol N-acetyl-beta-D-mannosaminyltransferase
MAIADANRTKARDVGGLRGRPKAGDDARAAHIVPFVWPLESPATPGLRFLRLRFDTLSLDDAVKRVAERSVKELPFVYVVTPNVDHRVRLEKEPTLHPVYETAWMSLCDSRILELMARFDGVALRAAPGADLVERLFEEVIKPDDVINVIGADVGIVNKLRSRFNIRQINHHLAPRGLRHDIDGQNVAAQFAAEHPARFTFICVGSPQQELIAQRILRRGDAKGVAICCGASLEFLTGRVPRAPRWMRNVALEWLHRLATDPVRMYHRYVVAGPRILPIWLESRRRHRRYDAGDGGTPAPAGLPSASIHPAA